jgi:hypothetical protein
MSFIQNLIKIFYIFVILRLLVAIYFYLITPKDQIFCCVGSLTKLGKYKLFFAEYYDLSFFLILVAMIAIGGIIAIASKEETLFPLAIFVLLIFSFFLFPRNQSINYYYFLFISSLICVLMRYAKHIGLSEKWVWLVSCLPIVNMIFDFKFLGFFDLF